jgi:hypothetical protein
LKIGGDLQKAIDPYFARLFHIAAARLQVHTLPGISGWEVGLPDVLSACRCRLDRRKCRTFGISRLYRDQHERALSAAVKDRSSL